MWCMKTLIFIQNKCAWEKSAKIKVYKKNLKKMNVKK
jgi:hypothetical protein